jgi:nucleoside-diphosphate-sugar epimerase
MSVRVLITGASGFIGCHLVAALVKRGVDVLGGETGDADLTDAREAHGLLDEARPEVVVNLARPTRAADSAKDHSGHVAIAANVLAASRDAGARRLLHLGSSVEYGQAESPVRENAPLQPTTPFGAAKAGATSLVLEADGDGIRTTVLRPFSVYGPGDLSRHLIPAAIRAAMSGASLPLTRPGVTRDWTYAGDVAEACALAIGGAADGKTVNIASGKLVANERVVELVSEVTGREIAVDPGAVEARPWDSGIAGSVELAESLLGWRASTGLKEGIRMTAAQ